MLTTIAATLINLAGVGPDDVKPAIERGLRFIEADGKKWKDERDCASCHHTPMMLWTLSAAKTHGYAINESLFAEMTEWTLREDNAAKILYNADVPAEKQVYFVASTYVMLAFPNAPPFGEKEATNITRLTTFLQEKQSADGSWPASGRQPVNATVESVTILNRIALAAPWAASAQPNAEKANAWLKAQPPSDEFQTRNLQLVLAVLEKAPGATLLPLIDRICEKQNADGGWSQIPEMPSDAYATGQTLYALARARCGHDFPATSRGIAFLKSTQKDDGSWHMESRKIEGVSEVKNLVPIIYAGSAWAMLGLMEAASRP
ncbi:MAG: terpene cyclase/mutase family protein [Candidatus Hydrogenedentes bacterium]|nr:terpene cyclase/mutase family protein [Candidatus Hydrogenedentota bacterium]